MKFWDSSALVPLLVEEEVSAPLHDLYLGEPGAITWWGTPRRVYFGPVVGPEKKRAISCIPRAV